MQFYNYSYVGVTVQVFDNGSSIINGSEFYNNNTLLAPDFCYGDKENLTLLEFEQVARDGRGLPKEIQSLSAFIAVALVVTLIGSLAVGARLYVRRVILKHMFLDDLLILLSLGTGLASAVAFTIAQELQIRDLAPQVKFFAHYPPENKMLDNSNNVHVLFVNLQSTFGRLSILYTFNRLSVSLNTRNVRIVIHVFSAVMVLVTVAVIWLLLDPCWPPTPGNLAFDPNASCILTPIISGNMLPVLYFAFLAAAVFNSVADIFCFALPFLVFRLQLISGHHRRALYWLFGFGFGVFLIGVARTVLNAEMITRTEGDVLVEEVQIQLFAIGEANAVMFGACLPVLAKPVREKVGEWIENSTWLKQRTRIGNCTSFKRKLGVEKLEDC